MFQPTNGQRYGMACESLDKISKSIFSPAAFCSLHFLVLIAIRAKFIEFSFNFQLSLNSSTQAFRRLENSETEAVGLLTT
jgi:hypothetical protein